MLTMQAAGERGNKSTLVKAAILAACVLIAAILISSMQGTMSITGGSGLSFVSVVGFTGAIAIVAIIGLILLAFLQLIELLMHGSFRLGGIQVQQRKTSTLATVIAVVALLAVMLILLRLGHFHNVNSPGAGLLGNSTAGGIGTSTTSGGFAAALISGLVFTLFLPLMATFVLVVVLVSISIFRKPSGEEDALTAGRSAVARAVERGIEEIDSGGDPRSAVIDVYREMRDRLGVAGALDRSTFTAREFGRGAAGHLGLTPATLEELTSLYEEARFSLHTITPEERDRASSLLRRILDELETGGW